MYGLMHIHPQNGYAIHTDLLLEVIKPVWLCRQQPQRWRQTLNTQLLFFFCMKTGDCNR